MFENLKHLTTIVKELKTMKTTRYLLLWSTACIAIAVYKCADIITALHMAFK